MQGVDKAQIDDALQSVKATARELKRARAKYPALVQHLAKAAPDAEAECTAEAIEALAKARLLRDDALQVQRMFFDGAGLLALALVALRALNGVRTSNVVTREMGELVAQRSAQGYSLSEIGLMTGLAASTVANIKKGRYKYSSLDPSAKVGARGHRKCV